MNEVVTIFVVDDDPALLKLYTIMLERKGHSVIANAYNGEEAVEIYKQMNEKPDVILMDYRMPLKDGIEATKEILEIDAEARILFVSADDSVKEEAIAAGACGFTFKTFNMKELIEDIEKSCG